MVGPKGIVESVPLVVASHGKVVPLVLHQLVDGPTEHFDDVTTGTFSAVLRCIGDRYVRLNGLGGESQEDLPRILLTFDDGLASDYKYALPMLEEARASAVFFLITERVGHAGYMTWSQAREVHAAGMEFGSHTATHPNLLTLPRREQQRELLTSRLRIEDELGIPVTAFAFPYGLHDRGLVELAWESGYTTVCTSKHGMVHLPARLVPRNAVNSLMSSANIISAINAGRFQRLRWTVEDGLKVSVRRTLGDDVYRRLRTSFFGR